MSPLRSINFKQILNENRNKQVYPKNEKISNKILSSPIKASKSLYSNFKSFKLRENIQDGNYSKKFLNNDTTIID